MVTIGEYCRWWWQLGSSIKLANTLSNFTTLYPNNYVMRSSMVGWFRQLGCFIKFANTLSNFRTLYPNHYVMRSSMVLWSLFDYNRSKTLCKWKSTKSNGEKVELWTEFIHLNRCMLPLWIQNTSIRMIRSWTGLLKIFIVSNTAWTSTKMIAGNLYEIILSSKGLGFY